MGDLYSVFSAYSVLTTADDVFIFTVEKIKEKKGNKEELDMEKVEISNIGEVIEINNKKDNKNQLGEKEDNQENERIKNEKETDKNEKANENNWILQKSGRFAHSKSYIENLLSLFPNLEVVSMEDIIPRYVIYPYYYYYIDCVLHLLYENYSLIYDICYCFYLCSVCAV